MFLTFYTGGRAGIVIALLACLSSVIIYFFPWIKYIFLTQKKVENKFFTIITLFVFSIFFFFFSSNPLISGRTQTLIQNQGIFSGFNNSNRIILLKEYFKETKIQDIILGKPGKGTNTACNTVTSDPQSEECSKTDSLPSSSLFSFGIIGIILYLVVLTVITNISYSPLMPMTFFVYSLSQIFPELIFPWTQFVLLLFYSSQKEKIQKLKISKRWVKELFILHAIILHLITGGIHLEETPKFCKH